NYTDTNNNVASANNIVGKISGSDSNTAIIVTAHFDAWFNGAIDNASGVASLINIAENLKIYSKSNNLNYDIIFCLTNLEMSRRKGSKAFIDSINNEYENLFNVNIDCIGVNNNQPMAIKNLSKIPLSKKLYDSLKESYDLYNIKYVDDFSTPKTKLAFEQNQGVSDYISFEKTNIPNMQIAQKGINDYILTEADTPDKLDINLINQTSEAIIHFLKNFK
ncbi:MAG: M28 family metallopeptidase, partial [Sarcina sp.]